MNISLTPELERFVRDKIENGQYGSTAEIFCEGLRLMQERDRIYKGRFEELKQEIMRGISASERGEVLAGEVAIRKLRTSLQDQYKPSIPMKNDHLLTLPAKQDIDRINNSLSLRNSDAAERFLDAVAQRLRTLANFPKMGRRRDEIAPRLRSFPIEDYLIFYRPIEKGTEVLRIVTSYSDLEFLFQD